jgi:hypothetical protein
LSLEKGNFFGFGSKRLKSAQKNSKKAQNGSKKLKTAQKNFELTNPCLMLNIRAPNSRSHYYETKCKRKEKICFEIISLGVPTYRPVDRGVVAVRR